MNVSLAPPYRPMMDMNNKDWVEDCIILRYIRTVVTIGVVLFLIAQQSVAFFKTEDAHFFLDRLKIATHTTGSITLVGSSTLTFVSACDTDRRNVSEMLADVTHRSVVDLSFGGQTISRSVNVANINSRYGHPQDIVLTVGITELDQRVTPPALELAVYTILAPFLPNVIDSDPLNFAMGLAKQPAPHELGFSFEGVSYPDYRGVIAKWFPMEKEKQTCPETTTHDPVFNKAYYWWNYVAENTRYDLLDMIADLNDAVTQRHQKLHVVLAPINYELIDQLDPTWRTNIDDRRHKFVDYLTARHVEVLDSEDGLQSDDFGTRWCACGHLMGKGRMKLVSSIAVALSSSSLSKGSH